MSVWCYSEIWLVECEWTELTSFQFSHQRCQPPWPGRFSPRSRLRRPAKQKLKITHTADSQSKYRRGEPYFPQAGKYALYSYGVKSVVVTESVYDVERSARGLPFPCRQVQAAG